MQGSAEMHGLELWQYGFVAAGAFLVGLGKSGLPGIGNITIVLLALALPPKSSVGVLLPILISADLVAVVVYRRHAKWSYMWKLAPSMVIGILIGYAVFSRVDDGQVRVLIGVILLGMTASHFLRKWLRRNATEVDRLPQHPVFIGSTGLLGGFATMIANAAGPVAALYFMAAGLPKYAYIGTSAWFFLFVNLFKVPLMIDLGIITGGSFRFSVSFMIYSILGAAIGPFLVRRINQQVFEILVWLFVVIGGLKLIIP
ncbi:MAG: sulfite exporter TauE/SafE family protein [Verrucomicrobiota bacterium]